MTNFARSSLALVLRAFFGGAKSCALVNIFMICPPMVSRWLADDDQILSLIAAISWLSNPATTQLGTQSAQGTQSWDKGLSAEISGMC